MKIELVFCVGSGSRSLKVAGRVIRVGPGDQEAGNGMGVQFDMLPEAERGVLESFLMSQLGTLDLPPRSRPLAAAQGSLLLRLHPLVRRPLHERSGRAARAPAARSPSPAQNPAR